MRVYADASLLVGLFVSDKFRSRGREFIARARPTLLVSDFAAAEFASVLARRVRTRELAAEAARRALAAFDAWSTSRSRRIELTSSDVARADSFLRRLDLNLRTPDALNIAIAERFNAALGTFDVRMADAARAVGLEVAPA
ncbi:MAG TPA: type II toxin-antitoxin system VapC family toxin [Caulobacteraceae bacterium]